MDHRALGRTFAGIAAATVLACGGGGGEPAPPPDTCSGSLAIDTPTYAATWETQQATTRIEGWAPTPGGPYGGNCPGNPSYTLGWRNETSGASGPASAWTARYYGVLGPYCSTRWGTSEIGLVMGDNAIRVSGGALGDACIVVRRVPDTTPPRVTWTSPADGTADVPPSVTLTVGFDEPIARETLTPASFRLVDQHGTAVPGDVTVDAAGRSATFQPAGPLAAPRSYRATVTTAVRDALGGNALATEHAWSFSTGAAPDLAPPAVVETDPPPASGCFATHEAVSATFSEPIDPGTLSSASFVLHDAAGVPVPGSVGYAQPTARFVPAAPLSGGAAYRATLTPSIRDLAGNALAGGHTWSFTTGTESGSWRRTTLAGAPLPRTGHAAVWTGSEMIVAGGFAYLPEWGRFDYTSTGARYDPALDRWTPIADGAPPRMNASAVWSGSEMLVWGGRAGGTAVAAGAAYHAARGTWRALPAHGAPANAAEHSALWTGDEMIVWGGVDAAGQRLASGARYHPASDTWRTIAPHGPARSRHSAAWTGREMIVWGGTDAGGAELGDGARYDPATDTWRPIAVDGAPSPRSGHTAVWSGDTMLVWGARYGATRSGGRYRPGTDRWEPTSLLCAPAGREGHTAVWSGTRMLVWGGYSGAHAQLHAQGAAYDPASDSWQALSATEAPLARYEHGALWTGTRLIVWGGRDSAPFDTGGVFSP